jgi:hypothetical protein
MGIRRFLYKRAARVDCINSGGNRNLLQGSIFALQHRAIATARVSAEQMGFRELRVPEHDLPEGKVSAEFAANAGCSVSRKMALATTILLSSEKYK